MSASCWELACWTWLMMLHMLHDRCWTACALAPCRHALHCLYRLPDGNPPLPVQAPAGMPWTACAEQRLLRACPAAHCSEVFSGLLQVPHCTAVMPCPVCAETLHACPATACTGCLMAGPAQLTGRSSFLEWALMARPALHGGLSGVLNWCRCTTARR